MAGIIQRVAETQVRRKLEDVPVVAILGPRQCGKTTLARDLRLYAPRLAPERLATFWRMCAHEHGQLLNVAKLGSALGVSGHTIRSYLELLERTFPSRLAEL